MPKKNYVNWKRKWLSAILVMLSRHLQQQGLRYLTVQWRVHLRKCHHKHSRLDQLNYLVVEEERDRGQRVVVVMAQDKEEIEVSGVRPAAIYHPGS